MHKPGNTRKQSSNHPLGLIFCCRTVTTNMPSIVTIYGTGEGQTEKVADRIVDELGARGHEVTGINVRDVSADFDLTDFDAVLVGASIHMGRHQKAVRKFVTARREELMTMPTGFFQVSAASGEGNEAGEAEAMGYLDEFIEDTAWRPDRIGLFGGALRFSEYGFLVRGIMKRIAKKKHPELDTSRNIELTDWDEVESFAEAFATFVEARLGERAETS